MDTNEIRAVMKYLCKKGMSPKEIYEANPEEFVSIFVTMDETWAHHFTPEAKQQSMQCRHSSSPLPKKAKTVPSAGKVMVSVFWDSDGILLLDFLNKGQTITGNYYANLVKQLREAIKERKRGKLSRKIVYHQDNAPSHRSLQAMTAIYDSGFEFLPHAPYSPDLALSDFHLFPYLKKSLSGIHFRSDEEVIDAHNTTMLASFSRVECRGDESTPADTIKSLKLYIKCNSQPATPKHIIDCIDSSIDELYSSPADTIKSLKLYIKCNYQPATPKHIIDCIDSSIDKLYSSPADTIKSFKLYIKCNSQPATPNHIIDCIDSSIDKLYSSPADTIKSFKLYIKCNSQPPTPNYIIDCIDSSIDKLYSSPVDTIKSFKLYIKCNSQPATPNHIIDCIDSSIDKLYSSPADTIKSFKLYIKCNSQPATPNHIIDCIDSSIDKLYSSPVDIIKSFKLYKLDTLI
ncbi:hypothetical protein LAZ67_8003034 [Cordylochernes scorpioides]|uniref:Transposase n=1 Tax=Cordylochernes scorpioides TaxID=51811 RepID=A0ABY6KSX0_9ARAC|nr:hypothetical protein LAZ67_8003034 [Cordylochernes scorpioides]